MSVARVIPGDSVLPQLRTVLDARAMSAVLGRCLAAGSAPIDITACEVERVKYRPGRNCLVGYRLELRDPSTGASREQRLCAGIYAHEAAQARYAAALGHAPAMSAGVPAVSLIEPLDMVVWVFPHERKLGALPAMTDGERLRETLLPPVVAARWGKALPAANF